MLTARVSSGELPPVEDRLPDQPVVFDASWNDVPTEDLDFQVGTYGGTLRAVRTHPNWDADVWAMLKETLVASPGWMDANPKDLRGNVILDYEISADGTTCELKWSDGVPVTTEDVRFTFEDVHMNDELQEFGWDIMQQSQIKRYVGHRDSRIGEKSWRFRSSSDRGTVLGSDGHI